MASTTECEELQSFLDLAAYNRQFIIGFSFTAERLFNLCTKNVLFCWQQGQWTAIKKLIDHLVRTPGQAYPNFSPAVPLSARLRWSWGFPVVPAVDLHVLPSFTVLCQSMNFVRKGGFSGLINFVAYSLNRILCPPGLGLPCVSAIRIKVLLRALKTIAQESDLSGFNWLGKGDCSCSIIDFLVANTIGTRKAKYDSKERCLEGIKLTTEVGC